MLARFGTPGVLARCALMFLLALGLTTRASAQAPVRDTTRAGAAVKDLPLTAAQRQSYVGSYSANLPQGGQTAVLVFEENDVLELRPADQGETRRLLSQGNHVFLAENTPDFVLTFVMDRGRATGFRVRKTDGEIVAVRTN